MKVATFNIENLFHRDANLVRKTTKRTAISWMRELERLIIKDSREPADFIRMRELSFLLEFQKSPLEPYVVMRRKAGRLYLRKANANLEYKASELSNWNGWIKLSTLPIHEIAIKNKARVISEANPDILLLQEVEDRQSLVEFNQHFLCSETRFTDILLIPGNDPRGLDMAIMTKNGYQIRSVRSHVNDSYSDGKYFDKDFQEFEILTPKGETIWILSAHLKEEDKDKDKSAVQRELQAKHIAKTYEDLTRQRGEKVILTGTLNAPSYSESLRPLLKQTDLMDINHHPSFTVDLDNGRDAGHYSLGAYRKGVNTKQRDYLLLSPEFFNSVKDSGLNRKGVWPTRQNQYRVFRSVQSKFQQASSHALIWVEL